MTLPLNRIIDVEITLRTTFPTTRGFGTILFFTDETTGPLTTSDRVRTYGEISELVDDGWPTSSEVHKMAETLYIQNPSPSRFKVGFWDSAGETIAAGWAAIRAEDDDFYVVCPIKTIRDNANAFALAQQVNLQPKQFVAATNDPLTKNAGDTTNYAYLVKNASLLRCNTHYHDDVDQYPDVAAAAIMLTVDFFKPNIAKTMKFKTLNGITPVNLTTNEIEAITGFIPGVGMDTVTGHLANTYVQIGGVNIVVEGVNATLQFFDTIQYMDWLQATIQSQVYGLATTNPKIPYTNQGVQMIAEKVAFVLNQGVTAGAAVKTYQDENGRTLPGHVVTAVRVEAVPESQRANRIAPDITFTQRLAGALHYFTVRGTLSV